MMRRGKFVETITRVALLLSLTLPYGGWSQVLPGDLEPVLAEEVFVHLSDPIVLTGDRLWLAITVKNQDQPSPSVIVYLDLLDREGTPVRQAMAGLTEGQAEAYLEIPDQLPSDNYLLRVYTRSSPYLDRDKGIYHRMVTVINPQSPPAIVATQESPLGKVLQDSQLIQTDKESYGVKEKVSLTLKLDPNSRYNLSVRQLSSLPSLPADQWKAEEIYDQVEQNFQLLPELYGHIVQGKSLASKVDTTETFFLSAHGTQSNLFLTNPLPNGDLFFETGAFRHFDYFMVQSSKSENQVDFILEPPYFPIRPKESFKLPQLQLSEAEREYIHNRMLARESRAYFYPDLSLPLVDRPSQFNADNTYLLDDYNRFEDLATTVREYVQEAFVRRRDKKTYFLTANLSYGNLFKNEPLVLVDAMPVFDTDALAKLNPKGIKSLEVVARYYFFQKEIFEGIISLTSFKNDFGGFDLPKNALFIEYPGIQPPKKINQPQSSRESNTHSPDFRNLLYWEAHGTTDATGRKQLSFSTSDLTGFFKIRLSYVDDKGEWAEASAVIEVK